MKVLIIGFGSIGQRHYQNFQSLNCEVAVLSRRDLDAIPSFNLLEEAMDKFSPTHVVIANETSEHGHTLNEVLKYKTIQSILVEKPLYAFLPSSIPDYAYEKVKVAYNLRFHPMISELKELLSLQKIISWNSYVGQYLPSWRPNRDYRSIYSSKKENGGGALRDLSHEIDLLRFFVTELSLKSSLGGHLSQLEIDSDDTYSLLLSGKICPHANIHMNCLDRIGQRFVTVNTENETYQLDLVGGRWRDSKGERHITFDRNHSYIEMSKAFLAGNPTLCSFSEGWNTNQLIEEAESQQ